MRPTLLALLILLTGCAGRQASPFDGLSPAQSRELAGQLAQQRQRELLDDLHSAFANHPPKNILILSGGGCRCLTRPSHRASTAQARRWAKRMHGTTARHPIRNAPPAVVTLHAIIASCFD